MSGRTAPPLSQDRCLAIQFLFLRSGTGCRWGISLDTLKKRLQRARLLLSNCLKRKLVARSAAIVNSTPAPQHPEGPSAWVSRWLDDKDAAEKFLALTPEQQREAADLLLLDSLLTQILNPPSPETARRIGYLLSTIDRRKTPAGTGAGNREIEGVEPLNPLATPAPPQSPILGFLGGAMHSGWEFAHPQRPAGFSFAVCRRRNVDHGHVVLGDDLARPPFRPLGRAGDGGQDHGYERLPLCAGRNAAGGNDATRKRPATCVWKRDCCKSPTTPGPSC